jgi:hypothetical protein
MAPAPACSSERRDIRIPTVTKSSTPPTTRTGVKQECAAVVRALPSQAAVLRDRAKALPIGRGPRSRAEDRSRRPEIGTDSNACLSMEGDRLECRASRVRDNRSRRDRRRRDRAEARYASWRHRRGSRRVLLLGTRRTTVYIGHGAAQSHRSLRRFHRHRHSYGRDRLSQKPDAEGTEEGERAQTGKPTVEHRTLNITGGRLVQGSLSPPRGSGVTRPPGA